jgi:hypothetical protein
LPALRMGARSIRFHADSMTEAQRFISSILDYDSNLKP